MIQNDPNVPDVTHPWFADQQLLQEVMQFAVENRLYGSRTSLAPLCLK